MRRDQRSECVINRTVEIFGDRWTLLVVRDIIFLNRRHFRELLTKSSEGIASNILADRLQLLVSRDIIVKTADLSHKQKALYSLTEKGVALFPLLMEIVVWGNKYLPDAKLRGLARTLKEGGPKVREDFMARLRESNRRISGVPKRGRRVRPTPAHKKVLPRTRS